MTIYFNGWHHFVTRIFTWNPLYCANERLLLGLVKKNGTHYHILKIGRIKEQKPPTTHIIPI